MPGRPGSSRTRARACGHRTAALLKGSAGRATRTRGSRRKRSSRRRLLRTHGLSGRGPPAGRCAPCPSGRERSMRGAGQRTAIACRKGGRGGPAGRAGGAPARVGVAGAAAAGRTDGGCGRSRMAWARLARVAACAAGLGSGWRPHEAERWSRRGRCGQVLRQAGVAAGVTAEIVEPQLAATAVGAAGFVGFAGRNCGWRR